jgi:hypothetical protein
MGRLPPQAALIGIRCLNCIIRRQLVKSPSSNSGGWAFSNRPCFVISRVAALPALVGPAAAGIIATPRLGRDRSEICRNAGCLTGRLARSGDVGAQKKRPRAGSLRVHSESL